jgi:hypothetical protein
VNRALAAALRSALQDAVADPACQVVVLSGLGRAFSAGQDLGRDATSPLNQSISGAELAANRHPLIKPVHIADKPIVAAVNGLSSGAAANLVFACDIVLAARFGEFHTTLRAHRNHAGLRWHLYPAPARRLSASTGHDIVGVPCERSASTATWTNLASDRRSRVGVGDTRRGRALAPSRAIGIGGHERVYRDSQGLDLEAVLALEAAHQQRLAGRETMPRASRCSLISARPHLLVGKFSRGARHFA